MLNTLSITIGIFLVPWHRVFVVVGTILGCDIVVVTILVQSKTLSAAVQKNVTSLLFFNVQVVVTILNFSRVVIWGEKVSFLTGL